MPLTLPPAQNADPAPVISSTCTSGFSPQSLIMLRSAGVNWSDSALRTSGRLSVMIATRSRMTHNSSSVPVSIFVSAVVITKLLPRRGCARVLVTIRHHTGKGAHPPNRAAVLIAVDEMELAPRPLCHPQTAICTLAAHASRHNGNTVAIRAGPRTDTYQSDYRRLCTGAVTGR